MSTRSFPPFYVSVIKASNPGPTRCSELLYTVTRAGRYALSCAITIRMIPNAVPYGADTEQLKQIHAVCETIHRRDDDRADERFVDPILLQRDQTKPLDDDARKRAKNRAVRNGVHGFELGKDLQVSPHFRRPHFAIRWTGQGRKVPRLVMVRGCYINKGLTTVPTGYEDD